MKKLRLTKIILVLALSFGGSITLISCQNSETDVETAVENRLIAKPTEMQSFENALKNLQSKSNLRAMNGSDQDRKEAINLTLYKASKDLIYSTGMTEQELKQRCETETDVISLALQIQAKNSNGNLKTK